MQIQKVTILISGIPIDGYTLDDEWFTSIVGLGKLVNRSEMHCREFIYSRWLQSRIKGGFETVKFIDERHSNIELIPLSVMKLYLRKEDKQGNLIAETLIDNLVLSNLQDRFQSALITNKEEK